MNLLDRLIMNLTTGNEVMRIFYVGRDKKKSGGNKSKKIITVNYTDGKLPIFLNGWVNGK